MKPSDCIHWPISTVFVRLCMNPMGVMSIRLVLLMPMPKERVISVPRLSGLHPVIATTQRTDGSWDVETDKGTIHADVVVNAAGLWAREVAAMAGFELPLIPMEHQYFRHRNDSRNSGSAGKRLPLIADRDGEYYMRQEGQGLLVGAYEKRW